MIETEKAIPYSISFTTLLTAGLILFKLAGLIEISWWWILLIFLFGSFTVVLALLLIITLVMSVATITLYLFKELKAYLKENFKPLKR